MAVSFEHPTAIDVFWSHSGLHEYQGGLESEIEELTSSPADFDSCPVVSVRFW